MQHLCREVADLILDCLPLTDLSVLAQTGKTQRAWVFDYLDTRRRVLFARFMDDVSNFVDLLSLTGGVVSGSCALSLVQSQKDGVQVSGMDILSTKAFKGVILDYLKNVEGYEISSRNSIRYPELGKGSLIRLVKGVKHVDLFATKARSAAAPIFQFYSTVAMNFISAQSICSAYPLWTAERKGLVHPKYTAIVPIVKSLTPGFMYLSDSAVGPRMYCAGTLRSTVDAGMLRVNFTKKRANIPIVVWCLAGMAG